MYIGIDSENGRILEGTSITSGRILSGMPLISPCKLTVDGSDLCEGFGSTDVIDRIYFREDFYDPRSRIRRGRLYKACDHFNQPWLIIGGGTTRHMETYGRHSAWLYSQQNNQKKIYALLGDKNRFTRWLIVDIEVIHTGEELITLKALTSFGLLPELLENEIPVANLSVIKNKLQQLIDDMYVASAESTVDNCREAASAIIGAYVDQPHKDLGKLISSLGEAPHQKRVAASAASVINLFHPRRKTSEQMKLGLRAISDDDAQFAISSVGLILVELNWGRW